MLGNTGLPSIMIEDSWADKSSVEAGKSTENGEDSIITY
jgi:hypothetical protein